MPAFPPIHPYLLAKLAARRRAGALSAAAIRNLHRGLSEYAAYITARLAALRVIGGDPSNSTLAESRTIIQRAADQLETYLLNGIGEYRSDAFTEVQGIWLEAAQTAVTAAREKGVSVSISSLKTPQLTIAGAFEALGGAARTWKTVLPEYVARGAAELDAIVQGALMQGVSPDVLARKLRPYIQGSREFLAAAEGLDVNITDLRSLVRQALHDPRARTAINASRVMRHNAERIAFSEVFNARLEAEVQHFAADPFVEAEKWVISPDRGTLVGACECDALAGTDFHGMGIGIYPVDQIPTRPHPWCGCDTEPVRRPYRDIGKPKPMPSRQIPAARARLPRGTSRAEADRIRDHLGKHLAISDNLAARQALRQLAIQGGAG